MTKTATTKRVPIGAGEDLDDIVGRMVLDFHGRGRPLPFLVAVVSLDGGVVVARYSEKEDGDVVCETIVQHSFVVGVQLPLNIMLIDATGKASNGLYVDPAGADRYLADKEGLVVSASTVKH